LPAKPQTKNWPQNAQKLKSLKKFFAPFVPFCGEKILCCLVISTLLGRSAVFYGLQHGDCRKQKALLSENSFSICSLRVIFKNPVSDQCSFSKIIVQIFRSRSDLAWLVIDCSGLSGPFPVQGLPTCGETLPTVVDGYYVRPPLGIRLFGVC